MKNIINWMVAMFKELLASLSDFWLAFKIFGEPVKRNYSVFEEFRILRNGRLIQAQLKKKFPDLTQPAAEQTLSSTETPSIEPTIEREEFQQQIFPNIVDTNYPPEYVPFIRKIANFDVAKIWTIKLSPFIALGFLIHWLATDMPGKFHSFGIGLLKLSDPPYFIMPIITVGILYLFIKSLIFLVVSGYAQFKTNTAFFSALIIVPATAIIVYYIVSFILGVLVGSIVGLAFALIIGMAAGIFSGLKIDQFFAKKSVAVNQ